MKVRATQIGYYNHKRRREGAVFTLVPMKIKNSKTGKIEVIPPEKQFSSKWMESYDTKRPKAAPPPEVGDDGSEFEDEVMGEQSSEDSSDESVI